MTIAYKLAPSVLAADFAHLADHVAAVSPHADLLHVDVMDGHFVPPISIGPVVVKALRQITELPLECHLMVTEPERQVEQFAEAGANGLGAAPAIFRKPGPTAAAAELKRMLDERAARAG